MIPLDISIINYFEKILSWDIFVQGFFMLNVFIVIFSLLLYMMPVYHTQDQSFFDFLIEAIQIKLNKFFIAVPATEPGGGDMLSRLTQATQFISLGTLILILAFILGTICSEVSDSFMDQSNTIHLGLKKEWASTTDNDGDLIKTDTYYKERVFYKIFGAHIFNDSLIQKKYPNELSIDYKGNLAEFKKHALSQIYYEGKHQILENDKWRDYLSSTQTLINLNQTFCLSSWFLIIASIISLITCFARKDKMENYKYDKFLGFEFIAITTFFIFFLIYVFIPVNSSIYFIRIKWFILMLLLFGILLRKIRGYRMTTAITFVIISFVMYHFTAIAWRNCEYECDSKTYGLIKHLNEKINNNYHDLIIKNESP